MYQNVPGKQRRVGTNFYQNASIALVNLITVSLDY